MRNLRQDGLANHSLQQRMRGHWLENRGPRWTNRTHARSINFQSNGAMKQGNRHDYPLAPFEIHQNPFQTCQSIAFDANSHSLNGCDLAIVYWERNSAATDYCNYAWRDKHRQALQRVKATEHIAGEQGSVYLSKPSVPTLLRLIGRKEGLIALPGEQNGSGTLPTSPDLQRKPLMIAGFWGHRESVTPSDVVAIFCTRLGYRHKPYPPLQRLVATGLPDSPLVVLKL